MDLEWNDPRTRRFVTSVGLITTNGKWGHDIAAAEWTHHISHSPSLISIHMHEENATAENIQGSKEFGVNLTSENQNWISSAAGNESGKEVDKVAALQELGVEFYGAKKIGVMMVKGAALNVECKLFKQVSLGDHIMFIGEVVDISADEGVKPIVYNNGRYWRFGDQIQKPQQEVLDKIARTLEKHRKK